MFSPKTQQGRKYARGHENTHEVTTADTPPCKGVAERRLELFCEATVAPTKRLAEESYLNSWAKAMKYACDATNMGVTSGVISADEKWCGSTPESRDLQPLGIGGYMRVNA